MMTNAKGQNIPEVRIEKESLNDARELASYLELFYILFHSKIYGKIMKDVAI